MIYTNQALETFAKEMDFGTIYQVAMGETGRGRKLMALTCPKDTKIAKGMNPELTIGTTKSGKPRINKQADNTLYMLLSAQGGYTRRGDGFIQVPTRQKDLFQILARGNGADGMAGRVGFWDCLLLKAPSTNAVVRVRTSGGGYGTPSDIYVIHEGDVYHCYLTDLEECCDSLGIEVPCEFVADSSGLHFGDDWVTL